VRQKTPAQRTTFLQELGKADEDAREELLSLLAAADDQITLGSSDAAETRDPGDEMPDRIGPYRVLRQIGAGGMGIVYQVMQEEPVQRKLALKLIKWGMDTREVVARFESERQALALMNHPSIAAVYDAGATERGRPYFAMEYVSWMKAPGASPPIWPPSR
jgi:serine/threonine protein kinase